MGTMCRFLAYIYGILGTIGVFIIVHFLRLKDVKGIAIISVFFGLELGVAMISVALYTLGEIYDRVFSSTFSRGIPTSVENGLTAIANEEEKKRILNNGGWKCPDCGKINRSYETTCKCGRSKNK